MPSTPARIRLESLEDRCTPTSVTGRVAVGADAGATPHVRVFDDQGTLVHEFFAYDGSFSGGVRVATGDVNGDGIEDIVTAAGPGGSPHVKVFDGSTGALIRSFLAFGAGFSGGVSVAAGDVDGDTFADIIVGAGPGGAPHVRAFSGQSTAEFASFFAYNSGFSGGITVAAGDVNNDSFMDIITGAGVSGGPHVKAFSGVTHAEIASFFAFGPSFVRGISVAAGDLNGDGHDDYIVGGGMTSNAEVRTFSGVNQSMLQSFSAYPGFRGAVRVAVVDAGTDGQIDIVTGAGPSGGPHVKVFQGNTLATLLSAYAFDPAFVGGIFVG